MRRVRYPLQDLRDGEADHDRDEYGQIAEGVHACERYQTASSEAGRAQDGLPTCRPNSLIHQAHAAERNGRSVGITKPPNRASTSGFPVELGGAQRIDLPAHVRGGAATP